MKRSFTSAFAFMLSVSVSSLALAQPVLDSAALTTPPSEAPKVKYVPSVPARDTSAASTGAPAQRYIPSVPARTVEEAPAPIHAAPLGDPDSISAAAPAPSAAQADTDAMYTAPTPATVTPVNPDPTPEAASVMAEPQADAEVAPVTPAAEAAAPVAPVAEAPAPTPTPEPAPIAAAPEPIAPPAHVPAVAETASGEPYVPSSPVRPISEKDGNAPLALIGSGAADPGLSDALAKAYNFNPELQSFRSRLKSVDEQIPQAYSGWMPQAQANYSYGYDKQNVNNQSLNGTHPETKGLTVTQPIFSGGESLARTSRAFNAVTLARAQLTDAEQRVLGDSVKAFIDVVRSDEILKLSINNEQVLKEQLQATKDRFKLGETTNTDVAQSESRLARATSDRVKAEGDFDVAKAAYLRVIGEAPHASLKMPAKLPPIPKSLEDALNIGLTKNPSVIAANVSREIADDDTDIAIASVLPEVSLQGSKSIGTNLTSSKGNNSTENLLLLNVSVPLYQGGGEYSRVRQNKRIRQQRKEEAESTRNETVQNVTSRWRDITTARASIVSNKAAVDSATVALNGVRQEADVGTRTTLDVLDAEQELFLSKVNLVTAQAQEVLAVYNLLAACGTLTAPDLALNVEVYNPKIHERSVKYRLIGF